MKAEDDLDQLIEQHLSGGELLPHCAETMAPLLAAAKRLVQLQEMALPPEFAHHLEVSLRARIRHLRRQESRGYSPQPVS